MGERLKVALILGGISNEREVSLKTGEQIKKNLDPEKYEVSVYDTKTQLAKLFSDCLAKKIDLCFLALHGRGGEDGSIQGMLDLLGVPYTGSNAMSSAITMDKVMSKNILRNHSEIPLAEEIMVGRGESPDLSTINFPCVVKPNVSGSSVGITIVKSANQIEKAINEALKHDVQVMIEEYIDGLEITVPILGDKALPVIEICPKNEFFDYEAKYVAEKCDEIVPARITPEQTKSGQDLALKIHNILKCSGMTRVDFILKDNKPYFLEINTIPGMTENSLCPRSAKAAGISFSNLLDQMVELALNQKQ